MFSLGNITFDDYPLFLAPMEDVTDPPFRILCKKMGADIMYTEFISSEGLIRDADKSVKKLEFDEMERPFGIQIFGHNIDSMVEAVKYAERVNPDFIDLNYGCPVKKVISKGAGAALLNDVPKMIDITTAVVKATKLPITVKTRLGWNENSKNIIDVAERLQDTGIKALAIHGRTRSQLYRGLADWTLIGEVKNNAKITIPIIGNGDVDSPQKAKEMIEKYNVDGLMIGRAVIGNPWIFRDIKHFLKYNEILPPPNLEERVKICRIHLERSLKWKGDKTGVFEMRSHYGNYFKGLPNFKPYRMKLVTSTDIEEIFATLDEINNVFGIVE